MTIKEAQNSTELYLTAGDVASLLHVNPQRLREKARSDRRDELGFPCSCLSDGKVIFPRIPFLEFFGYEEKPAENTASSTQVNTRE